MANATIERGDAGNRKLSKKRSMGRIDGAVALVMAIGAAPAAWTTRFDAAAFIG
jgi:phage terminase large subunit-like protein